MSPEYCKAYECDKDILGADLEGWVKSTKGWIVRDLGYWNKTCL